MNILNKSGKKRKRREENGFEEWGGYMNAKITKLEKQFEEEARNLNNAQKLSDIFNGISIFVNGYTEPSSEDLRLLMLLHGGTYHHYYRSHKTTHVIASNLPYAKMGLLKTMKIVKPAWIIDSIAARRLLDYKKYLLFGHESRFQLKLKMEKDNTGNPVHGKKQGVAKTAVNEEFLSEFYSNSRLHHLSTMGAMFKQYIIELREKHDGIFPGRERIKTEIERHTVEIDNNEIDKVIMHIDMDCFFVSVALRNHPELRGKPVAVAHAKGNPTHQRPGVDGKFEYEFYKKKMETKLGIKNSKCSSSSEDSSDEEARQPGNDKIDSRSEVASCSYEARKFGVRNGMYLGAALKLCPSLKTVPYDFEGFKEVSYILYNTVAEYTLDIEAVSCDELFIDCTMLLRETKISPLAFARILRSDIYERTACASSTGIGSNKLLARLGTARAKPNGQFHVLPENVADLMSEIVVYDLPGVGRTIGHKLKALGVKTCEDLQNMPIDTLKKEFGAKTGETLFKYCRGIDDRTLKSYHERKSVSAEVNYGIRFSNDSEAITFLKQLSLEVATRLKNISMKGRHITFKVMIRARDAPTETAKFLGHGACDYTTCSSQLPCSSNDDALIAKHVISMYHKLSVPATEFRGIGIQVTKLESCKQACGSLQNFFAKSKNLSKDLKEGMVTTSKHRDMKFITETTTVHSDDSNSKLVLPPMSQIDPDVLDSLPKSLRVEILKEYGVSDVHISMKKPARILTPIPDGFNLSQIDENVFNELPPNLKEEIKTFGKRNNSFNKLSLREVRNMIAVWVSTETEPKKFDASLLVDYACNLIQKKKIESADVLTKCLRRHIINKKSGDENWKMCYEDIIGRIQSKMQMVFGKGLYIEEI